MGRHRREYPLGKLRLKYPKAQFDSEKEYTLYFEYTSLYGQRNTAIVRDKRFDL